MSNKTSSITTTNKLSYTGFHNNGKQSKTLMFELKPIGRTTEHLDRKGYLADDIDRAESYKTFKEIADNFHKNLIEESLATFTFSDTLKDYFDLWLSPVRTNEDTPKLRKMEAKLRKELSSALKQHPSFAATSSGKRLIDEALYPNASDKERQCLDRFKGRSSYLDSYTEVRSFIYTDLCKHNTIAYRVVNENLKIYLENILAYEKLMQTAVNGKLEAVKEMFHDLYPTFSMDISIFFTSYGFDYCLSQNAITRYNILLGGWSDDNGIHHKGLNNYINEYNQTVPRNKRLPKLNKLQKMILSEENSMSFIIDKFENDLDLANAIRYWLKNCQFDALNLLIWTLDVHYNLDEIHFKNDNQGKNISDMSQALFKNYHVIRDAWDYDYDIINAKAKSRQKPERYAEKRDKAFKKINSFSLSYLANILSQYDNQYANFVAQFKTRISVHIQNVQQMIADKTLDMRLDPLMLLKPISSDTKLVEDIKRVLDSLKDMQRMLTPLLGEGTEPNRDAMFYSDFEPLMNYVDTLTPLYNKVRNYITKKPYSTKKTSLYFGASNFGSGFDVTKLPVSHTIIMRDKGCYYLAVVDNNKLIDKLYDHNDNDGYEYMVYKQIPSPIKYFSLKNILPQDPPDDIRQLLEDRKNGAKWSHDDETRFIDYIVNEFLPTYPPIHDKNGNPYFSWKFKNPDEYESLNEFFDDVSKQAYQTSFRFVSRDFVDDAVENGDIFFFQIYNQDFSPASHGKPSPHTLWFRALFSDVNLETKDIRLKGNATAYFRPASIFYTDEKWRKGHHYEQLKNKFKFPIIKDKRYALDKFFFHITLEINCNATVEKYFNNRVNEEIRKADRYNILAINRGERNLLYAVVMDQDGTILEQKSFNIIKSELPNKTVKETDYWKKLHAREKERDTARKSWKSIECIKDLKKGYLSYVVKTITDMMFEYNAVLVMENLDIEMKRSRQKIEKNVYAQFQNAIIQKLSMYINKDIDLHIARTAPGGTLNPYQLTYIPASRTKTPKQNGFVFFLNPWNITEIDPTTGFVDLFQTCFRTKNEYKDFFAKFKDIRYNEAQGWFEFDTDYTYFRDKEKAGKRTRWNICSYGTRLRRFRNPDKNYAEDAMTVYPTQMLKDLFDEYNIPYASASAKNTSISIKDDIIQIDKLDFYKKLLYIFKLIVQLRNTSPSSTEQEDDYIISPVINEDTNWFYDSRDYNEESLLPCNTDANGAYSLALKCNMVIDRIKNTIPGEPVDMYISNADWLDARQ